ncbi:hypothetical protein KY327_01245 [Candidatus Woesearchaeota archaeon]|nr:hypothetical protein [Candidatus Woesearchaeota archaeon]
MRVGLLGPTNMDKFCRLTGLTREQAGEKAAAVGKAVADAGHELRVVFNYGGMLKLVGDAYKEAGGKLTMIATRNDYDWDVEHYLGDLAHADEVEEKPSWHDMLLSLVTDSDVVVCAGLSSGVLVELGYMKWNVQDERGKVQKLVLVEDLLRDGRLPPELGVELDRIAVTISAVRLKNYFSEILR